METVGIIGLGLIGGSMAKALKYKYGIKKIVAYNRSLPPLVKAYDDNVVDIYTTTIDESFKDCDMVFLCTTIDTVYNYTEALLPFIKKGCILTDVGSTKKSIMDEMSKLENIIFIGGHPMAGSEKTGYNAAKTYLFENAYYVLTPTKSTDSTAIDTMQDMVRKIGAIPIIMDAQEHDRAVAAISHVPHIVASTLVNMVSDLDESPLSGGTLSLLAAGGFKDITRIASSSPALWDTICHANKHEITKIIKNFKTQLDLFENALNSKSNTLPDLFSKAKVYRDSFNHKGTTSYIKDYKIKVEVEDKPGIIATVATLLSVNNINISNIGIINNREYESGVLQIVFDREQSMEKSIELLKSMNFSII